MAVASEDNAMRCEECHDRLDEMLDRLSQPDAEVSAHLDGCAVCRDYAEQERDLREGLKAMRVTAGPGLAGRLDAALRAESTNIVPIRARAPALRMSRMAGSIAAALVACLITALATWMVTTRHDDMRFIAHDAVAAHLRSLVQENAVQVASSESHTVKPWFASRIDFSPPVKDLVTEGFTLAGGRLDYVASQRVAALVYKRRLHTVSVFIWPKPGAGDAAAVATKDNGLQVLSWAKGGMMFAAVSDLNEGELKELPGLL